jgi:galactokinase
MPLHLLPAWTDTDGAARALAAFAAAFGGRPDGVWAAPGRVNLIGEHTDYNGGLSLPVALPHRTFAAVRRRDDGALRCVSDIAAGEPWTGRVDQVAPGAVTGWAAYAVGPLWALRQTGWAGLDRLGGGFDIALVSCLPLGAGLSSSAAVGCAVVVAAAEIAGLTGQNPDDASRARLAEVCVRAENAVAGAPTGGMDQAAALRTRADHALLLDARDGSAVQVPLALGDHRLLVIDTRAHHALNDGQYAVRRATSEAAAATLGVPSLREVTDLPTALARLGDDVARRRVRHVVTETARTARFAEAVAAGRLDEAARLMDASHASLRDDYEVSSPELDLAVATSRQAGALGARMTGGGFGGSAVALVADDAVPPVAEAVRDAFAAAGLVAPQFLLADPSGPAGRVA